MKIPAYYELLLDGLDGQTQVEKIVRGVSWTGALLSDGRCGVAMHTQGETRPRMFPSLEGLPVRKAGQAARSWNLEEAGEGMAVINAFYNTNPDTMTLRYDNDPVRQMCPTYFKK